MEDAYRDMYLQNVRGLDIMEKPYGFRLAANTGDAAMLPGVTEFECHIQDGVTPGCAHLYFGRSQDEDGYRVRLLLDLPGTVRLIYPGMRCCMNVWSHGNGGG